MLEKITIHKDKSYYWLAQQIVIDQIDNGGSLFVDSVPLFGESQFNSLIDHSPWLFPFTNVKDHISPEILNEGIVLGTDDVALSDLMSHLRSLLTVFHNETVIMFRWYDPQVLLPFLNSLEKSNRTLFMGNCIHLLLSSGRDSLIEYENDNKEFVLQKAPWFIVEDEMLETLYNIETHARIIERNLWKIFPDMMEKFTTPSSAVMAGLQKAIEHEISIADRELWSVIQLALQVGVPLTQIEQKFSVTAKEKHQISLWRGGNNGL